MARPYTRKGAKMNERWRKWDIAGKRVLKIQMGLATLVKAKVRVQLGYRVISLINTSSDYWSINAHGRRRFLVELDRKTGKVTVLPNKYHKAIRPKRKRV